MDLAVLESDGDEVTSKSRKRWETHSLAIYMRWKEENGARGTRQSRGRDGRRRFVEL